MGHLINPISARLSISKTWNSHWVANKDFTYCYLINRDVELRRLLDLFFLSKNFTSKWHFIVDNIFVIRTIKSVNVIIILFSFVLQELFYNLFINFFKMNSRVFFFNFLKPYNVKIKSKRRFRFNLKNKFRFVSLKKKNRKKFSTKRLKKKFYRFPFIIKTLSKRKTFVKSKLRSRILRAKLLANLNKKVIFKYKSFIRKLSIGFTNALYKGFCLFLIRSNLILNNYLILSLTNLFVNYYRFYIFKFLIIKSYLNNLFIIKNHLFSILKHLLFLLYIYNVFIKLKKYTSISFFDFLKSIVFSNLFLIISFYFLKRYLFLKINFFINKLLTLPIYNKYLNFKSKFLSLYFTFAKKRKKFHLCYNNVFIKKLYSKKNYIAVRSKDFFFKFNLFLLKFFAYRLRFICKSISTFNSYFITRLLFSILRFWKVKFNFKKLRGFFRYFFRIKKNKFLKKTHIFSSDFILKTFFSKFFFKEHILKFFFLNSSLGDFRLNDLILQSLNLTNCKIIDNSLQFSKLFDWWLLLFFRIYLKRNLYGYRSKTLKSILKFRFTFKSKFKFKSRLSLIKYRNMFKFKLRNSFRERFLHRKRSRYFITLRLDRKVRAGFLNYIKSFVNYYFNNGVFSNGVINTYFLFPLKHILTASQIVYVIKRRLLQKYSLNFITKQICKILDKEPYIQGYRITCNGRFTRRQRATHVWSMSSLKGKDALLLNTFSCNVDYAFADGNTKYGVYGIKVWLVKKNFRSGSMNRIRKNILYSQRRFRFIKTQFFSFVLKRYFLSLKLKFILNLFLNSGYFLQNKYLLTYILSYYKFLIRRRQAIITATIFNRILKKGLLFQSYQRRKCYRQLFYTSRYYRVFKKFIYF